MNRFEIKNKPRKKFVPKNKKKVCKDVSSTDTETQPKKMYVMFIIFF